MKIQGIIGKGTGKLGNTVWAVNSGVQINREYVKEVRNPSTIGQVNQRSKFKLLSQLSAAMASVIVIPRKGLQSSRNLFVKKNSEFVISGNGEAQISYENIQLTNGNTGLPAIAVTRDNETGITMKLAESAAASVNRVVYVVYKKSSEDQLQLVSSMVQNTAGASGTFDTIIPNVSGDVIVYAYGIKDNSGAATAKYSNYQVANAEDIAYLVSNRSLKSGDYTFTQTRGTTLFSGDSESAVAGEGQSMVYITAQGPGAVSATGFTNGRKAVNHGTSVTITATPEEGCTFLGWKYAGMDNYFSTTNPVTLTITGLTDVIGVFNNPNNPNGWQDDEN